MHEVCHRCTGEIANNPPDASDGRSLFCPHCGAPQLLLADYVEPLSTGTDDPASSTGALPPPRPVHIEWKLAISSAGAVAAIAVVLSFVAAKVPNVSPISFLWVISASLTTLALYQRRRPLASMNAGIGAKIGILVGVILSVALGAAMSAGTVVARFALHNMVEFDSQIAQLSAAVKIRLDQLSLTRPVPPEAYVLIKSTEFRTAIVLTEIAIVLMLVVVVSIFGGAFGGLLRTRRKSAA